ncbi:GNAT family N-acetyltransferase [Olivibacter domesticus]|uniref:Ribosomal protein S18 acetylase RimI n=1 Tax=Olivibacter domesticus TaxID=407022 RepID=A0A1H7WRP1_OLID1|nr:GNAT family N-acetyltransferase [Olivibacter domesticus]SEM23577.1 Ribosomal protein S18 acetylase RimI [Olivibacter domesticus]
MEDLKIKQAELIDLNDCASLFDEYRVFYNAESNLDKAKHFIEERLRMGDSTIFLLRESNKAVGFAQLYPSYSSVSMSKIFILNDLYVVKSRRGRGHGKLLINAVLSYAKTEGCVRVSLSTAKDNPAQKLYEGVGFKESSFKFYNFNL